MIKIETIDILINRTKITKSGIIRSINLSVEYAIKDIIQLAHRYTPEEIIYKKLKAELSWDHDKLEKDINRINQIHEL